MSKSDIKIAIIGLGYVGLPLAVEFAKKYKVIGFDITDNQIKELEKNNDSTLEIKNDAILSVRDNSTIICGVTLGENSFIGAGSVVKKNVLPNSLVYGVPAKHIKFINN